MLSAPFAAFRRLTTQLWESPIAHGSFSGMIGNFASTALFMVRSVLIARALGLETFGLMAYALALTMFVGEFIDMRGGDLVIRFVGSAMARKEHARAATYLHLGVLVDGVAALAAMVVIAAIMIPLTGGHPQHETLQPLIGIYVLAVPFGLLKRPFTALLITLKRFPLMTILQLATRLIELGVIVAVLPLGVMAVTWSAVLMGAFEFLLTSSCALWVFWRRSGTLRGGDYRQAWRSFRPFAVYGSLVGSLQSLAGGLDVVVLGALRPPADVGFYAIARSAALVLSTALGPVSQAVYPLMNEAWALNDRARVRRLVDRLVKVNGSVSLAAIVFLFFSASWLVNLFYGPAFLPAAGVLRLMVVFIGLQTATGWMRQMVLIAGYPHLDLIAGVIGTAFFLAMLVPFVSMWGALGLAYLLILDVFVMVITFGWILMRRVRLWAPPPLPAT